MSIPKMPTPKLIDAAEEVLRDMPKTRDNKYLWMYVAEVLRKMGFRIYIEYNSAMPSPESILKERRDLLNKKNKFPEDFEPEENATYEKPNHA